MLELQGRSVQFEALVDSGNLLKDPIDLSPVMLIKEKTCISLFPFGLPKAYDSEISNHLKRYIRLIPITRNGKNDIYVGIRPDRACILSSGKWEDIRITVVIDEERGTFGGFDALMPSSAIEYI